MHLTWPSPRPIDGQARDPHACLPIARASVESGTVTNPGIHELRAGCGRFITTKMYWAESNGQFRVIVITE